MLEEKTIFALLDTIITLPLMVIELMIATILFCKGLPKRKYFVWRVIGVFIITIEFIFLILFIYYKITNKFFSYEGSINNYGESVFKFLLYVAIFFMVVLGAFFYYRTNLLIILFNCSGAYATQHMAKNISNFILFFANNTSPVINYLTEVAVCLFIYFLVYFIFIRKKAVTENQQGMKKKVLLALTVIIVCIGVSRISLDDLARGKIAMIAETIYAVLCCLFILNISSGLSREDVANNEIEITKQLLHRASDQYKLSKENIELINIKCHDLKHQMNILQNNSSPQSIKKIQDAVMIYDSIAKTKNDALDIILTEKNLYCQKNNISLTCFLNGEDLNFMEETDIYSLFGNALSNAIESVIAIEDVSQRSISLNVKKVGNILTIHIENYYQGKLEFEGEYPKTFKDKDYHGYGMKSMNYITKKYGGCMSVVVKDNKFILDFAFPR